MPDAREMHIIDELGDDGDETLPFRYSITSYGADYTIDGLVRRIGDGSIYVPSFQRGFIWSLKQASRFVESLLLGLPVPGIFLSKEVDSQRLLVIDGQQRLRSLQYFYEGVFAPTARVFFLTGVQGDLDGITYHSLREEDRRRLDDSILHATVVRQDEPSADQSSIYYIFERINTGAVQLAPQEIRTCMYHGPFIDLLKELNNCPPWRKIYGPISKRMRDQELILRFLSLYLAHDYYKRPMKEFLNGFLGGNRALTVHKRELMSTAFVQTISTVFDALGTTAFKPARALNAAIFDAVMVGVAERLKQGSIERVDLVKDVYDRLLAKSEFEGATGRATADEQAVEARIRLATQAFSSLS